MADFIKVHIARPGGPGGESLWATRINATSAKLDNIPFGTEECTLGDVVEIDSRNEIIGVIERVARTRHGTYKKVNGKDAQQTQWDKVRHHFERYDVHCESAVPGFFAVAVPNDVSNEQLTFIFGACAVPLTLLRTTP